MTTLRVIKYIPDVTLTIFLGAGCGAVAAGWMLLDVLHAGTAIGMTDAHMIVLKIACFCIAVYAAFFLALVKVEGSRQLLAYFFAVVLGVFGAAVGTAAIVVHLVESGAPIRPADIEAAARHVLGYLVLANIVLIILSSAIVLTLERGRPQKPA